MDSDIRTLERQAAQGDAHAQARLERARERAGLDEETIIIDGETYTVASIREIGWGDLHEIEVNELGRYGSFIVSESAENAGKAARARWADMAENDQQEFRAIVGDENILQWALGNPAGPGSVHVRSLSEWLDLHLDHPEEEWASYDGCECEVERASLDVIEEIGYVPTVAYRNN